MREFYLVVGAESSGTKLATQILINAGVKGDAGDQQLLDEVLLGTEGGLLPNSSYVWRRSFPHNKKFYAVETLFERLRDVGNYEPWDGLLVITMRNFPAMAQSQVDRGHVKNREQAYINIDNAYRMIFDGLTSDMDYTVVSYDLLTLQPKLYLPLLLDDLGVFMNPEELVNTVYNIRDMNTERLKREKDIRGVP